MRKKQSSKPQVARQTGKTTSEKRDAVEDEKLARIRNRMEAFDDSSEDENESYGLRDQHGDRNLEGEDGQWSEDDSDSQDVDNQNRGPDVEGKKRSMPSNSKTEKKRVSFAGDNGTEDEEEDSSESDSESEESDQMANARRRAAKEEADRERSLTMAERLERRKLGDDSVANRTAAATNRARSRKGVVSKRQNKNQPTEISSRVFVSKNVQVVPTHQSKRRDPRFDSLSGKFNEDLFQKAYSFLEKYRDDEIDELRKQLKAERSSERSGQLQVLLNKLQQTRQQDQKKKNQQDILQKRKREEREAVKQGKNPFYLKEKEKKRLLLENRFKDLEKEGKLDAFLAKKRKKNANKDHRWLPTQRR